MSCSKEAKIEPAKPDNPEFTVKTIDVGKGPDALFLTPEEDYLFAANVEDSIISVVDVKGNSLVKNITVSKYPWGFSQLSNSDTVAVSSYDGGITLIDFKTLKIVTEKKYKYKLGGIATSSDGKFIFVNAVIADKVLRINASNLEITDEYATGKGPDGIGISKDGNYLFTTNTGEGTISAINIKNKKAEKINTGGKPELVHYNKDHSKLFIGNFKLNKAHIIDTESRKIVGEIEGVNTPEEAILSKSEKHIYIVSFDEGKVYEFDPLTLEKTSRTLPTGKKPIGVVLTGDDRKAFVSNYGDNNLSVIYLNK